MKTWAKINIIENEHWMKRMNRNKIWLFGKTNKIDKSLARLIKKKWAVPTKQWGMKKGIKLQALRR